MYTSIYLSLNMMKNIFIIGKNQMILDIFTKIKKLYVIFNKQAFTFH